MSIARHHAEWLSLVPVSGPFLSLPVLIEVFNAGLEPHDPDQSRLLRQEYGNWQESIEKRKADPAPHQQWIKFVLTRTLELDDRVLAEGQAIPQTLQAEIAEHHELLRPNLIVIDPNTSKPRLLVQTYPRSQELTSYVVNSRWKASPDTRMTELLHATSVPLGLITNGEHWMLVDAPKGETTGYASWYASLWLEEPITFRAFRSLLSASRFFNVPDDQTLEALFKKSANNQSEVTDQLGYQVRRAVEELIHEIAKIEHEPEIDESIRKLISEIPEAVLYESALTVMMRLVFLFCAEERELIPSKPFPVFEQNYSVSTISKQLRELADDQDEALLERRYDAWPRLLAAFRAVYGGLQHDDVNIPAYGGNLFNPDRFPFLEGRKQGTTWRDTEANPLPVSNRTVLHLLEDLQFLQTKVPGSSEKTLRRLSFRALDIEQIGHVYEGLLDHTAKRATEPFLGLAGTRNKEAELPLAELEKHLAKGETDLIKFLKEETGKSETALKKSLHAEIDSQDAARFRTVCQGDDELWKRVQPFAGFVRRDNFGYPLVIPKGKVFVTSGTDRRSSGTHYTPKSLTEPIVQYTLEPLVYVGPAEGLPKDQWKLKSAKELLQLKICDMACGSGAFLVQACRYMSERLLEAWDAVQQANPGTVRITPEGELSDSHPSEQPIPLDPDERKTFALRIVAQRCLYGVDINPLAAEMAKLSLWLLTLAKDKPFEFLDHAIRCGDSLVGLHDIDQLRHFNLKPDADDAVLFGGPFEEAVAEAIELRLKLEDMPSNTVEDVEAQEKLLKDADDKIARLRCAADLLVAAEFWGENAKDKMERLRHAAVVSGQYVDHGPTEEFERVAREAWGVKGGANDSSRPTPHASPSTLSPFHWPLEFPEVMVKRGGFDAFVGNPPFMGGGKIGDNLGGNYRPYLVSQVANELRGTADVCTYFLLRAWQLLGHSRSFGFLTTNTIAEGDTREVGLEQLDQMGCRIVRAISSVPWPGGANLEVACLWGHRAGSWEGFANLNGAEVDSISAFLKPQQGLNKPFRLCANRGKAFKGHNVYGMGFVLDPQEADTLRTEGENCKDVVQPFLNGDDITSRPDQSPSRWIINFRNWPIDRAKKYSRCFAIIEERVKPERETNKRKARQERWWVFGDYATGLENALAGHDHALVAVLHTKFWSIARYRTGTVFSHALAVFYDSTYANYSLLQSSIHEAWAREYSGSLETRLRYTPSDCFDTFAVPAVHSDSVSAIGENYEAQRRRIMLARQEGLTKTYNRFHDPDETSADIQKLRQLHVEMDNAVATAYVWTDLALGHGFHENQQGVRFTISEAARREVLQRLLKLNHERYAEEVKEGLHDKKGKAKVRIAASKPKKAKSKQPVTTKKLFDDDALFPSNDQDAFLCGLACDLVADESGLPPNAYRDELVIAVGYQRHKRLLTGQERTNFAKLAKAIPAASGAAARRVPWENIQSVLTLRKAIFVDGQSAVQRDLYWDSVRTSYPAVDMQLVALIRKAAAELRELQTQAQASTSEVAAILYDFEHDREQMCGAST